MQSLALRHAVHFGHLEIVKALLAADTCTWDDKNEALYTAVLLGHQNIAIILLASGASPCGYALHTAAAKGWTNLLRILLDAGVDLHYCNDLALSCAVSHGHLKIVEMLLANGADFRATDHIAIRQAVNNNCLEITELLASCYTEAGLKDFQETLQSPLLAEVIARHMRRGSRTKVALREPRPDI